MSRERPILFSAPMVRAILDGRKTMTRRVVKPQPEHTQLVPTAKPPNNVDTYRAWVWKKHRPLDEREPISWLAQFCPFGQPGDRLWVREKHKVTTCRTHEAVVKNNMETIQYAVPRPDGAMSLWKKRTEGAPILPTEFDRWRPSIFMPRWASRLTLKVTSVRVERLRFITNEDIEAEGVVEARRPDGMYVSAFDGRPYRALPWLWKDGWDALNAKRGYGWGANPWVWVVEFKHVA